MLEEAYEAVDAIDDDNIENLREHTEKENSILFSNYVFNESNNWKSSNIRFWGL